MLAIAVDHQRAPRSCARTHGSRRGNSVSSTPPDDAEVMSTSPPGHAGVIGGMLDVDPRARYGARGRARRRRVRERPATDVAGARVADAGVTAVGHGTQAGLSADDWPRDARDLLAVALMFSNSGSRYAATVPVRSRRCVSHRRPRAAWRAYAAAAGLVLAGPIGAAQFAVDRRHPGAVAVRPASEATRRAKQLTVVVDRGERAGTWRISAALPPGRFASTTSRTGPPLLQVAGAGAPVCTLGVGSPEACRGADRPLVRLRTRGRRTVTAFPPAAWLIPSNGNSPVGGRRGAICSVGGFSGRVKEDRCSVCAQSRRPRLFIGRAEEAASRHQFSTADRVRRVRRTARLGGSFDGGRCGQRFGGRVADSVGPTISIPTVSVPTVSVPTVSVPTVASHR